MEKVDVADKKILPAGVTGNREARPKHWYVAQVRNCCERRVANNINTLGLECFVPIQKEVHHWSDRDKVIDRIVIPMVVFVNMTEDDIKSVKELSSVYGLLGATRTSNHPAVVPDDQIENFRKMLNQQEAPLSIVQTCDIKKGDKVKVVRGPLKGVTGIVHYTPKGTEICVEVEMLGYACAKISQSDIELVGNKRN